MTKRINFKATLPAVLIVAAILTAAALVSGAGGEPGTYDNPYICSMHPDVVHEGPGECDRCGMALVELRGHEPGTALPGPDDIYTSPDNPMFVHEGPGKDPDTGAELVPIVNSPFYEPPAQEKHHHEAGNASAAAPSGEPAGGGKQLYTCGMHPDVIQDEPGLCPICNMELTPLRTSGSAAATTGERKIAYWVAPMDPNYISDKPGKSPMGMDLVPVYNDQLQQGVVSIDPVTRQNIGVVTTTVELRDLAQELRSNGTVTVAEDALVYINPKVSGWIERLYVSRTGDHVRAGQPLLEIYSPELVAAQEEFLLALDHAALLATAGIAGGGSNDLLTAARRRLELWDISPAQIDELQRTRQVKRTLTLHSPISGVVLHKTAVQGTHVKAGTDLFRVADLSTVWIEVQVYEYELPWVSAGDRVTVSSAYDPTLELTGRVDYVYPYLDPKTRTARLRVVAPNRDLALKPDMYVEVSIRTRPARDAVAVSKSAVLRSGTRDIVFVALGEGRFLPREVKLGLESDDYYQVLYGVSEGTEVVTAAQFLLDSEAKLQEAVQRRLQQRLQSGEAR